jgi:hypothetical protein
MCSSEALPFELRSPELSLKVNERAFDLDLDELVRSGQHHVGRLSTARRNWHLETSLPRRMQAPDDGLGKAKLTRVAQADRRDRIQAPSKLVSTPCRQATANVERDPKIPALHQTDQLLGDSCGRAQLSLGQAGRYTRDAELVAKPESQVGGPRMTAGRSTRSKCLHAKSLLIRRYQSRTRPLQTVLVHGGRWTGCRVAAQALFVRWRRTTRIGADAQPLLVSSPDVV